MSPSGNRTRAGVFRRLTAILLCALAALATVPPAASGREGAWEPGWQEEPAPRLIPAAAIDEASALEEAIADVVDKVGPAVVSVEASYTIVQRFNPWGDEFFDDFFRRFFEEPGPGYERKQPVRSLGSGVIVGKDGYILTNAHVIGQATKVSVRLLNKKEYKAKIVGRDEGTDLAVLRIEPDKEIIAAPLGDSDRIRVGQWAIAIGNPFALENTVTVGVISAKGRQLDPSQGGAARYTSFIQTDASINRGNSGGPLLNIRGEVIGINTMIYSTSGGSIGIGFAIPSNMAHRILESIIKEGRFIRPQMGITYRPVAPEVAKKLGLDPGVGMEVTGVLKGTGAALAGLVPSDIILSVDGKELRQTETLRETVLNHQVGDRVTLGVFRKGKKITLVITLKEAPQEGEEKEKGPAKKKPAREKETAWLGMTIVELTEDIAKELGARDANGVLVARVDPDSPAAAAGLQRGDIIREVEQQPISNIDEFTLAKKKAKEKDGVLLLIERQGSTMYVVVNPKGKEEE